MITHRQIEAFKAIMEAGTVLRAAELLHVSQSAVSHLLGDLEHDLGYNLFDRRKGRLKPRGEAVELYDEVERSFSGLQRVEETARRIGSGQEGRLRVAAISSLSLGPVPIVARRFLDHGPAAHMSIATRSRHKVIKGVADLKYDLGLVTAPVDEPEVETALVETVTVHCILPLDHPLADRGVIAFNELADTNFIPIMGEVSLQLCRRIERLLREGGVASGMCMDCSTLHVACALVANGVGASLVPRLCIGEQMRPHLRAIPTVPKVTVDLAVINSAGRPLSKPAKRFVAAYGEILRGDSQPPAQPADAGGLVAVPVPAE